MSRPRIETRWRLRVHTRAMSITSESDVVLMLLAMGLSVADRDPTEQEESSVPEPGVIVSAHDLYRNRVLVGALLQYTVVQ